MGWVFFWLASAVALGDATVALVAPDGVRIGSVVIPSRLITLVAVVFTVIFGALAKAFEDREKRRAREAAGAQERSADGTRLMHGGFAVGLGGGIAALWNWVWTGTPPERVAPAIAALSPHLIVAVLLALLIAVLWRDLARGRRTAG
jgi:hypothetical protein